MNVKTLNKVGSIKVTTNHNDKMKDLWSLSTAPGCNPYCQARTKNKNMICSHCYSCTMNKRFKNLRLKLEHNANILTNRILPKIEMPILKPYSNYFRFEAFGDLINEIQVLNYFNIAKSNSTVNCALWTKNPFIIDRAIKKYHLVKPENLKIIGSSYFINKPMVDYYKKFDFIDNIFTVYDPKFAKENNITINCGAKSCATCGRCYQGNHKSYEINELLK